MRGRKRKAMEYDTNEGCKKCGILAPSLYKHGQRGLCRTCECVETLDIMSQTPCGQHYCQRCGILIESVSSHDQNESNYCSACKVTLDSYIHPEDFSKVYGKCKCEFCSNDHNAQESDVNPRSSSKPLTARSVNMERGDHPHWVIPSGSPSRHEDLVDEELRNKWEREQLALKKMLVVQDCPTVTHILKGVKNNVIETSGRRTYYIGGVDISFIKDNNVDACAALVILSFPDLKVVYKRLEMIKLTAPYIPGFLAFREVDSIVNLYRVMLKNAPQYKPDVIFVDGNGQLHPRGFGLACHLGVVLNVPCVGVAKTLIHVDGIEENAKHKAKKETLKKAGDTFPLTTTDGQTLGMALRSTKTASNPIYVSVGHKISLQSAVTLVQHCCKYRIPEPTRFADLDSREFLLSGRYDPQEFIVETLIDVMDILAVCFRLT